MRLVDLDPHWLWEGDRIVGIWFVCPAHQAERESDEPTRGGETPDPVPHQFAKCSWSRIAVEFKNPADGGPPARGTSTKWERTGNTFEDLTLSPSINAVGHWHGWVKSGEVTTV